MERYSDFDSDLRCTDQSQTLRSMRFSKFHVYLDGDHDMSGRVLTDLEGVSWVRSSPMVLMTRRPQTHRPTEMPTWGQMGQPVVNNSGEIWLKAKQVVLSYRASIILSKKN